MVTLQPIPRFVYVMRARGLVQQVLSAMLAHDG
jgi:hypothetical protein